MIRIKNIYYMLAYAFQALNEDGYAHMSFEDFEHAEDLFAAILARGIANQIKRGLGREYLLKTEPLTSPHGKIEFFDSLKRQMRREKQVVCTFDELSENAYVNRILKTTASILLRSKEVKPERKKALKKVLLYFNTVSMLARHEIEWMRIKYHRNNATYKMLMSICRLVMEGLLPDSQDGTKKLMRFKEEQMARLYEKFLLEFFRKHSPSSCRVSAAHVDWTVDDGITEYLPAMKTDITIECGGRALIIDAKYYGRTMQTFYDRRTIHSNNLYQIFTYVKNEDAANSGRVSGLLLYAKTDEEVTPNHSYWMNGNRIGVQTLDLNADFSDIRNRLETLIFEWLNEDIPETKGEGFMPNLSASGPARISRGSREAINR